MVKPNILFIKTIVEDKHNCIALKELNYELKNNLHVEFVEAVTAATPRIKLFSL